MPESVLITLADAIVASLQSGTFSQPFEVQRGYRPLVERGELDSIKVLVIPKSLTIAAASRLDGFYDAAIDVGVLRSVDPDDLAQLDALMKLVEELGDHLRTQRLEGVAAAWVSLENEPVFAPEHLEQKRQFTSVLTVTYRLRR